MQTEIETTWVYFEFKGPVETQKYRTNKDATVVEFWSDYYVAGLARKGWNRTKSASVQLSARNVLKKASHAN